MKPNRHQASGYEPLKFDVRSVPVPIKWKGYEFEYRHGYGKGLERDGVMNPVTHHLGNYDRRRAWFAGYATGKKTRKL